MAEKLNVALLYGGRSVEHEISVRSAKNVATYIDRESFNVTLIGISKTGSWFLNAFIDDKIESGTPISIQLDAHSPYFIKRSDDTHIKVDVVFPILHGTDGEDGSIQGLFKSMNLPVVGSGVLGSAISMDKIISKKILKEGGVPVANYLAFNRSQKEEITFEKVVNELGLPFMVKSAALGSSVGVSMVKSENDFKTALEDSFRYDQNIILEEFVKGRELECAVIGNEQLKASFPGEIIMIKDYDFYTYEAKYEDEDAIEIKLPAEVDAETTEKIRQNSMKAYQALRCEDFARVDLFLKEDGSIIVNEINTIPGFTSASMFPMMWQQMGMTYTELISELIHLCLQRFNTSKDLETDYDVGN